MTNRFIQSTYGTPGNFELAILDGSLPPKLIHFWRDNSTGAHLWYPGDLNKNKPAASDIISSAATSSAALIQSSFGTPNHPGNFELLVLEGSNLVHYYRDNTKPTDGWVKGGVVSTKATGAASFIQSTFRTNPSSPGNFEAVVLEGSNLVHYYRDNSKTPFTWKSTAVITSHATGPGSIIQSTYGTPNNPGNFEVVVPEGNSLNHYWRDNSNSALPWHFSTTVTSSASDSGSIIQSDYGIPNAPGNFEVVVPENGYLVHHWRDNGSGQGNKWNVTGRVSDNPVLGPATIIQSTYNSGGDAGTSHGNFEVVAVEGAEGASSLVHRYRDNAKGNAWAFGAVITPFPFDDGGVH
jgi:hypothetical protein